MKKVFICSPYRNDDEDIKLWNEEQARIYMLKAFSSGYAPFVPHLLYTQVLTESADERCVGIEAGLKFLEVCDEIWVCGSDVTEGMQEEIKFAHENGVKVVRV